MSQDSSPSASSHPPTAAYVAPFAAFMAGLALVSLVQSFATEGSPLWLAEPKYWVYPLQTVVCGALLIRYWRCYDFGRSWHLLTAVIMGLVVLALWISPQWLLGFDPRLEGFNPGLFAESPGLYWLTLAARFVRLVVVVPLLEEIFWRGFLLRYTIKEDWRSVPFGAFTWMSFGLVTLFFGLAHFGPDFAAALATGAIYNLLAIRTKSLGCCVLAHAVTNLVLGIYIMQTGQWGFW